jgi:hypothetical protein
MPRLAPSGRPSRVKLLCLVKCKYNNLLLIVNIGSSAGILHRNN